MEEPRLIPVGKIARTHGLRGAVKIFPYGGSLTAVAAGDKLYLRPAARGTRRELTVERLNPQGKLYFALFREIERVEDAEFLIGSEVLLPESQLPAPPEGEYYHYQLIGAEVLTIGGQRVGTLTGIIETAGDDVYVVDRGEGQEALIPAVEEIVREVDVNLRRILIDPPEGLIDDL